MNNIITHLSFQVQTISKCSTLFKNHIDVHCNNVSADDFNTFLK